MFDKEFETVLANHPRWVFASVVGSHNYGTATEKSDVDLKVMYVPTFKEFYNNKFDRTSDAGPTAELDYTCHPIQEYVRHSLKGNMNFWELWFSDHLRFNPKFIDEKVFTLFKLRIQLAVCTNYMANYNATRGMAMEKFKRFERKIHLPGEERALTALDVDRHNKEMQHCARLLSFLIHYEDNRKIVLDLPDEYASFKMLSGFEYPIDANEGRKLYDLLNDNVTELKEYFQVADNATKQTRESQICSVNDMVFDLVRRWA